MAAVPRRCASVILSLMCWRLIAVPHVKAICLQKFLMIEVNISATLFQVVSIPPPSYTLRYSVSNESGFSASEENLPCTEAGKVWMLRPVLVRPDPPRYAPFPSMEKAWLALEPGHWCGCSIQALLGQ